MTPYGTDPRFVTPERRLELLTERFLPWPLQVSQPKPSLADWPTAFSPSGELGRGFVSNSRFASAATERVIPRTNRSAQRKAVQR